MPEVFINNLIQFCTAIPAAIICYLPMKNQVKYSIKKLVTVIAVVFAIIIPCSALFCTAKGCNVNSFTFLLMPFFFIAFQMTLNAHISQAVCAFCLSVLLMSFTSNCATGFDAILHPYSFFSLFSIEAGLFQLILGLVLVAVLAVPLRRFGSSLVDTLNYPYIWYTCSFITFLYFILNMAMVPHNYQTLYTNNVFPIYWIINIFLFLMVVSVYVLFYFIANGILTGVKNAERVKFLEMQEKQYVSLCHYMEETAKMRHDFRQTIHTLQVLAWEKEYDTLQKYLNEYSSSFPVNEVVDYCKNMAVNALLNFYAQDAESKKIRLKWSINLPVTVSISDKDLCNVLGNILENVINACVLLPEGERYQQMSVTSKHQTYLYIVSTNSFNGKVKKDGTMYLSSSKTGSGTGLSSISFIAETNGGFAQFSNSDTEFFIDVMLQL